MASVCTPAPQAPVTAGLITPVEPFKVNCVPLTFVMVHDPSALGPPLRLALTPTAKLTCEPVERPAPNSKLDVVVIVTSEPLPPLTDATKPPNLNTILGAVWS